MKTELITKHANWDSKNRHILKPNINYNINENSVYNEILLKCKT